MHHGHNDARSSTQTAYGDGLAQGIGMATACAPPLPMERTPDARQAAQKAAEAESGGLGGLGGRIFLKGFLKRMCRWAFNCLCI